MNRAHRGHVSDAGLIEVLVAEHDEVVSDAGVAEEAEHLLACDTCAERYQQLSRSLERARQEANAEADEAFPEERLAAQRDHILRRLEAHAARVIPFPLSASRRYAAHGAARPAVRWIAAAAAAGLLLGLTAGRLVDVKPRRTTISASRTAANGLRSLPSNRVRAHDEELFLSQVDEALYRPQPAELQALDAFTPRVLEARNGRR